jgi:putative glutamine amidotransferase
VGTHAPTIGIVARLAPEWRDGTRVSIELTLAERISDLVVDAGGAVLFIGSVDSAAAAGLDAVLLPGGADLDPRRYGAEPVAEVRNVHPRQDALDLAVGAFAVDRGLPMLGICRGHQVLNVLRGGTLIQHLSDPGFEHIPEVRDLSLPDILESGFTDHAVTLEPDSILGRSLGTNLKVRSSHHQAIGVLGAGLRAVGWSDDGVIEAVEDESRGLVGIQWHPEAVGGDGAVISTFVDLARNRRH